MADRLLDLAASFSDVLTRIQVFVRRLLELHIFKLVAFYTVWVALKEVSVAFWAQSPCLQQGHSRWPDLAGYPRARPDGLWQLSWTWSAAVCSPQVSVMNLLLVVLWAFALPYPRFRPMASCLSTVWTCIIIVCKMLYQLKIVNPHEYSSNCTEVQAWGGIPGAQGPLRSCPNWRDSSWNVETLDQ